jgi:CBS domain-containing protein
MCETASYASSHASGSALMRVGDQMSSPGIAVSPDALLSDIAAMFAQQRISGVPVASREGLLGVVSTTDLLRAGADARHARDVMSAPAVVAHANESIEEAAWRMSAANVHRVIVTERDLIVGVLSASDILEEVMFRRLNEPIATIMRTPVESIEIGEPIDSAVARIADANVHGLLVVDGMAPAGMFTHREALAARRLPRELRQRPVEEVMSHRFLTVDASTRICRAAGHASVMNARRIVVVDGGHLVGIVSSMDFVRALARVPG